MAALSETRLQNNTFSCSGTRSGFSRLSGNPNRFELGVPPDKPSQDTKEHHTFIHMFSYSILSYAVRRIQMRTLS